ncbi:MAG: hypothetical protein WC858_00200 [Parcubacteria group bacterium]
MTITKCDICKKTIASSSERFHLTRNGNIMTFASYEICFACSKPLIKMLKDNKLIKVETKKDGRKK